MLSEENPHISNKYLGPDFNRNAPCVIGEPDRRVFEFLVVFQREVIVDFLEACQISGGKFTLIAIVAIVVFGQSELTAIPSCLNSSAIPKVHILIPYLEIV